MPINHPSEITIERRFDVRTSISEKWFRFYVSELARYGGDNRDDVNCDIRLGPDFENRVAFRNRQAWTDYVIAHLMDATESSIWQEGGYCPTCLMQSSASPRALDPS
jgi:hypothetical protein